MSGAGCRASNPLSINMYIRWLDCLIEATRLKNLMRGYRLVSPQSYAIESGIETTTSRKGTATKFEDDKTFNVHSTTDLAVSDVRCDVRFLTSPQLYIRLLTWPSVIITPAARKSLCSYRSALPYVSPWRVRNINMDSTEVIERAHPHM